MLIKFWLGLLITLGISVLLMFLFVKLFKFLKKKGISGGIIGFFVGAAIVVVYIIIPARAYVVSGTDECDHFVVLGSPDFEMSNGQKISVNIPSGFCLVINDTEDRIMIEEVVYGGFGFSPSPDEISGMTADVVETHAIDHFFDDVPPDEISVSEGSDEISRFWLRRARE